MGLVSFSNLRLFPPETKYVDKDPSYFISIPPFVFWFFKERKTPNNML